VVKVSLCCGDLAGALCGRRFLSPSIQNFSAITENTEAMP
jgi:hypothetical protein